MSTRNAATWSAGSNQPVAYNQSLNEPCTTKGRAAATGIASLVAGAGIGAVLMYLLDPEEGAARRDSAASKAGAAAEAVGGALGSAWQHATDAAHSASEHAASYAQDASDHARGAASSAADQVSGIGGRLSGAASDATGWVSSKFDDLRGALPSRKAIQRNADPRQWFQHEPTFAERYVPSAGATVGAGTLALATLGAMYFLDPQSGRTRRAKVQSRVTRGVTETGTFLRTVGRRISNRTQGMIHEATDRVTGRHSPASDQQLAARVSSTLGHLNSHGSVTVEAEHGTVYLRGSCSPDEVDALLKGANGVQGVQSVVNFLNVNDSINTDGKSKRPTSSAASQI